MNSFGWFLAVIFFISTLVLSIMLAVSQSQKFEVARMVSVVSLNDTEKTEYQSALQAYFIGNSQPLTNWVLDLKKTKKYGVIPNLPDGFSRFEIVKTGNLTIHIKENGILFRWMPGNHGQENHKQEIPAQK